MKKLIYTLLLGAALLMQPVSSSSESYIATRPGVAASAVNETVKIAAKSRDAFDALFRRDGAHKAAHSRSDARDRRDARADDSRSEPEQWPLLIGALLFIGLIIRRRTAVR